MKKIIVLGSSKNQIEYLKVLKQKFQIILLDKNINSPGRKFAYKFFHCAYDDTKKINNLFQKKLIKSKYIFSASSHFAFIGLSYLAKKIGIKKFPSKKIVSIILNKSKFYEFLKKNKTNIPWTRKIYKQKDLLKYSGLNEIFFLKSDYGKSPHYIYKGSIASLINRKINWKKDNFLKNNYLLQKKFNGTEIRVNVFKKKCICYYFKNSKRLLRKDLKDFNKLKIPNQLIKINKILKIEKLLVKYDVIISNGKYVILDIGLDPPQRMLNSFKKLNKNFYKFYTKFFINL